MYHDWVRPTQARSAGSSFQSSKIPRLLMKDDQKPVAGITFHEYFIAVSLSNRHQLTFGTSQPTKYSGKFVIGAEEEKETFLIPENLLVDQSGYFKAMHDDWVKDGRPEIRWEDEDPNVFAMLHSWFLKGDVELLRIMMADEEQRPDVPEVAVDLYILAEKMQVRGLKDWIISAMIRILDGIRETDETIFFPIVTVALIYENLPKSSKLKKLAIDSWASISAFESEEWLSFRKDDGAPCPQFTFDLVERFHSSKDVELGLQDPGPDDGLPDIVENTCLYHEHEEGGFCPWSGKGFYGYVDPE